MKLTAKFSSTHCNNWPLLKLSINNKIIFTNNVVGELYIEEEVDIHDSNILEVCMLGKRFGPIWDTKVVDGVITKDQTLTIQTLEFDDVDIKPILVQVPLEVIPTGKSTQGTVDHHNCTFNFNSCLQVSFSSPVYNWIITEKFIKKENDIKVENSFGSWNHKFNYAATRDYLEKIKKLL
jgi:hypothetical protein